MSKTSIREGISKFLQNRVGESPYLIPLWYRDLESQYLVHPGSNPVDEGGNSWTDGSETWSNHRWPHKAGTNPKYNDRQLTFSPGTHIKRFGSTWWDFRKKRSIAVALDIDLEGEHAESTTTVTSAKLEELVDMLQTLDYITLVRSSGGCGVHIYSFFDKTDLPVSENHNEHAQVAKALVSKISADLGYNLIQHMDAVGVVFWLWSCDSPEEHRGYQLIQEQTRSLGSKDLKEYMNIDLAGPNQKIKVTGYTDSGDKVENVENGGGYKTYPLEPAHSAVLKELEDMGFSFIWQPSHNMAHTHTVAIKLLCEKLAKEGRPLAGVFTTVSGGTDKTKPNCYMTPRPGGVFQVKRFGTSTAETPLWNNRDGDTWCYLNQETPVLPVLKKFASVYDGNKLTFEPSALELAMKAFNKTMGKSIDSIFVPITVRLRKDGTMLAQFKGEGNFDGWARTKEGFQRELPIIHMESDFVKSLLDDADQIVRHMLTPDHDPYGWSIKSNDRWVVYKTFEPIACIVTKLFGKDASSVRAEMLVNPWILHHHPFGKEYPGGRLWNKAAPQLSIEPASVPGPHPHWDLVMDHLGNSLDSTVAVTPWCQQWGVHTGADYLRVWIAALIRDPMESLPYLFFYGPQNSGKSSFHESIARLFTCGVASASTALSSGGGYNAEIANAVLGFVEEKDLSVVKDTAYARIKEWIMARTMLIHPKGHTPYQQPNTLHMIQLANRPTSCPMEDGDTRITAILVNALQSPIPRKAMEAALESEKANFLRTILTLNMPESPTRLRVPMLATEHKHALEEMHQTPFESFCSDFLHPCPGQWVKFTDLYKEYEKYCTLKSIDPERKNHILQLLRNRGDKYLIGIGTGKQNYIANFTLDLKKRPKAPLVLNDKGRLTHV